MPAFKDDQIIIIAPGSQTTLAQLGLPESLTPAKLRVRSCMFPAEKEGEWEPYRVRRRNTPAQPAAATDEANKSSEEGDGDVAYEEDFESDEGAVWPIVKGRVVNWPCFYALLTHVYNTLNPPFHTAILLISQPVWTPKEHEKLTQFFFEKFKPPAFTIMDSAVAASYAFGLHTATVVDVGQEKVDVTAIREFLVHDTGRVASLPDCGGDALTKRLFQLLEPKGFTREMCEQLKRSPICEILPVGTSLPGTTTEKDQDAITNPAAAASTGATSSGPTAAAAVGNVPRGPGPDTEVGDEQTLEDENEGVLDVASIVTSNKMSEFLAKKEKEKTEKGTTKKKGGDTAAAQAKAARLPNFKRERNTFFYEKHDLLDALSNIKLTQDKPVDAPPAEVPPTGVPSKEAPPTETPQAEAPPTEAPPAGAAPPPPPPEAPPAEAPPAIEGEQQPEDEQLKQETNGTSEQVVSTPVRGTVRREIEVGVERFQAASDGILDKIADAIHRTIGSVEEVNKRSELWDSLVVVGNGAKIRGFREALLSTLQSKYVISPSSATIFTSELPSNISTPAGTGANTPQPQFGLHGGSQVNPLLLAATTAQNPHLLHPGGGVPPLHSHNMHSSHGQTPTSVKFAKIPEYFPEWKDVGFDEATFLGAQVGAKVLFVVDQGPNKGYMTRTDYNDQGPTVIHDYSM